MDRSSGNDDHQRLVEYSPAADLDLAEIFTHTTKLWGWDQAERYNHFLLDAADEVARGKTQGRPVAGRPGRLLITRVWHSARGGHHIVYELTPRGIYVVRILHTAMDALRHIDP